jgi:DNA-binding helix-hairpin-helix protein with protein kinase domain
MIVPKSLVIDETHKEIELRDEIAPGAQGTVWRASGDLAVKLLYDVDADVLDRRMAVSAKSMYDAREDRDHWWVVWPLSRVFDSNDGSLVGYSMPYVAVERGAVSLADALRSQDRHQVGLDVSARWTLRAAMHVATAAWWAETRRLFPVDLSPRNIVLGRTTAMATLLDPDGIAVAGSELPNAPAELQPPEQLERGITTATAASRWALAVTLIRMLLQGVHPLRYMQEDADRSRGQALTLGQSMQSRWDALRRLNDDRRRQGATFAAAIPPEVMALADECFKRGHYQPNLRPQAREWVRVLKDADERMARCSRNPRHWHDWETQCMWCEIADTGGLDPYADGIPR